MRFWISIAAVCGVLAGVCWDGRADVLSTQRALSELMLWDGPATPAFAELTAKGYEVIPDLLAIADNPNIERDQRSNALRVLGTIARRNRTDSAPARTNLQSALPILVRCVNSIGDQMFAGLAAKAIGDMGAYGKPAIPDLINATKSPFPSVRVGAIYSLGEFGADAKDALPALKAALDDADLTVRTVAAESILKVSPRHEQKPSSPERLAATPQTASPSDSGPMRGFEISGTFELVTHLPKEGMPGHTGKFWVAVEGRKWRVRVKDLDLPVGGALDYTEVGANDSDEHFFIRCNTNRLAGSDAATLAKVIVGRGSAQFGQVPDVTSSMMVPPIWLAYCSSNYLASVKDGRLLPVFLTSAGLVLPKVATEQNGVVRGWVEPSELRRPKMAAEWTVDPDGGLPSSVVYYDRAVTNAVLRVVSFRKVGLLNLPESFVLERYFLKRTSSPNSEYELTLLTTCKFQATDFRPVSGIGDGRPSLPGQVEMCDFRFPELGHFDYVITTGKWPTTEEIRARADFKKALEEKRAEQKEPVVF